ncbi:MAG: carboxymuconolactone decarboxylase family protein [Saprospiraceae bacterium]
MPHIELQENIPGIKSLFLFRPDTGQALYELAQVILREESPLSIAERELIAAFVSRQNECIFCTNSHAASARVLYESEEGLVDFALNDYQNSTLSDKMKSLLKISECVAKDARTVSNEIIEEARKNGAQDREIHDTVLIAASFCMFNRYVDGLDTFTPLDNELYKQMGERMANNGYVTTPAANK